MLLIIVLSSGVSLLKPRFTILAIVLIDKFKTLDPCLAYCTFCTYVAAYSVTLSYKHFVFSLVLKRRVDECWYHFVFVFCVICDLVMVRYTCLSVSVK